MESQYSESDFEQENLQHQLAEDSHDIIHKQDCVERESNTMDESPYEQQRAKPILTNVEQFEKLRNIHQRLLQNPSKQTLGDILDKDVVGCHPGSEEFTRLFIDEVKETGDELAVGIGMHTIFEIVHNTQGITYLPTIFETMADRLQHLSAHREEVVPHSGSQCGLYNSLYGLHVVSVAKQQMPEAADFLQIYTVAAPNDPFLPVYEDWMKNSQAFNTRSNDKDMYVMTYKELARWLRNPRQHPHLLSRAMMMLELHCAQHNLLDRARNVFLCNQREQETHQGVRLDETAADWQFHQMTSIISTPSMPAGGLRSSEGKGRPQDATLQRSLKNRKGGPSNFGGDRGIRTIINVGSPANILPPRNALRPRLSNFCDDPTPISNFGPGSSSAPQLSHTGTSNFGSASNGPAAFGEDIDVIRPSNSMQRLNLSATKHVDPFTNESQGQDQTGGGRSVRNPPRKAKVRQVTEEGEYEEEEAEGPSDESMEEVEVDDSKDMDYHE